MQHTRQSLSHQHAKHPEIASFERLSEAHFTLRGKLDFKTVADIWPVSEWLLKTAERELLQIDLAGVSSSNSSGLALLLAHLRLARSQGKTLQLKRVPPSLQSLIRITGLAELFNF